MTITFIPEHWNNQITDVQCKQYYELWRNPVLDIFDPANMQFMAKLNELREAIAIEDYDSDLVVSLLLEINKFGVIYTLLANKFLSDTGFHYKPEEDDFFYNYLKAFSRVKREITEVIL